MSGQTESLTQNSVLFVISRQIPQRVIEFYLTHLALEALLHGQRIGYIRVSSFDQNPERQLEQVQVDKHFTDKASRKDTLRPKLVRYL
jgi:hypothetical protein